MTFIVLLLENTKLFYILLLFCLYIEILAVSTLFKCLRAIKCSESRVETLQIFRVVVACLGCLLGSVVGRKVGERASMCMTLSNALTRIYEKFSA